MPKVYALCEDDAVIGSAFYVMEFLDGRIFWDPRLPGLAPAERRAMFQSMNTVIAALHSVDHVEAGLAAFGRPGNYLARQVARWSRQYQASETEKQPAMDRLIEWLPCHLPPEAEPRIVHGDYRIDNLIYHPTEPRVIGVLDWELSTIGDPLADFAYHAMAWRVTPELFRGLAGVDFEASGIPTEEEYVASYCERTGRGPDRGLGILHGLQPVPAGGDHAGDRQAGHRRHRREPGGRRARPAGPPGRRAGLGPRPLVGCVTAAPPIHRRIRPALNPLSVGQNSGNSTVMVTAHAGLRATVRGSSTSSSMTSLGKGVAAIKVTPSEE